MKIEKTVTVNFTPQEVEKILKDHLKEQGVAIERVDFVVGSHNHPGDWQSSMAPYHSLDEVVCEGKEIKK